MSIIKGLKWRLRVEIEYFQFTCGLKLSILPSSKPRSTLNSFFIFATASDLGSYTRLHSLTLPILFNKISHCAPWGQTRNCSSPNSRLEEAPDSEKGNYSFTHPLASCRWSWSWPLKVLSSPEYKGLTLCPWNYWVSIWLVLPSRLVSCILMWPYVFGSWVYGNWLGFPPTENWLHLTSPSRLN